LTLLGKATHDVEDLKELVIASYNGNQTISFSVLQCVRNPDTVISKYTIGSLLASAQMLNSTDYNIPGVTDLRPHGWLSDSSQSKANK